MNNNVIFGVLFSFSVFVGERYLILGEIIDYWDIVNNFFE